MESWWGSNHLIISRFSATYLQVKFHKVTKELFLAFLSLLPKEICEVPLQVP